MTELDVLLLLHDGLQVLVGLTAFAVGLLIALFIHIKGLF